MIPSRDEQRIAINEPGAAPEETGRSAAPEAGGASLDKVRDILFGGPLRDVERRFARLEERLVKETADLKADVKKRLDALEAYVRTETESLAGQIRSEQADRTDATAGLARELKETAKSLERRTTAVDEQHSKTQREIRQQLLEQHQRLSEDIRQTMDDVLAALAREAQELRADKTDRTALAALLTEMAMRLTNDFRIPGAEDLRNG